MIRPIVLVAAIAVSTLPFGCGGSSGFNAKFLLEVEPVNLEVEQVVLTTQQLDCGVREDLWEPPRQTSQAKSTARLTAAGKALKFDDDVSIGEVDNRQPYVQVRGKFPVQVTVIGTVRDGPQPNTKQVPMRAAVTIEHSCFTTPLPIMGVRRGRFMQDAVPVFQFREQNGIWRFDSLVH